MTLCSSYSFLESVLLDLLAPKTLIRTFFVVVVVVLLLLLLLSPICCQADRLLFIFLSLRPY